MSCYHPIEAVDCTPKYSDFNEPRRISFHVPFGEERQEIKRQGRLLSLPCRHCVGCRLDHSREWANRCLMELSYHDCGYFVTLTYDDEYLPRSPAVDRDTGEILSFHGTLVKSDLQKFLKRLRFAGQKIRYYACGEYGTTTYRPHYHLIMFGLRIDDLESHGKNFRGDVYFTSQYISRFWPFGYNIVAPITWQTCAYTSRYVMKKATHGFDKRLFFEAGIEPEFQTMSLKPAIGARYMYDHPEIFEYAHFYVSTPDGGRKMYLPEYFKKCYAKEHPQEAYERSLKAIEEKEVQNHLKLLLTDKDFGDILKDEEDAKIRTLTNRLPRNIL